MMDKDKILNALTWFFIIVSIILFIWMVIGDSPTFDQFAIAFFAGFMIKLYAKVERIDKRQIHMQYASHSHEQRLTNLENRK